MRPWIPTTPLEPGVTLLEASAGTGKTWSITSLILRLVVEGGLRMRELVVVTFTVAATADLRRRIHGRLELAEAVLSGHAPLPEGDEVLAGLLGGGLAGDVPLDERLRRLRGALVAFDECVIRTIHGFCQQMLQQHAFESGADFELELVAETDSAREQLVDDFLSRELYGVDAGRWRFLVSTCGFERDRLLKLSKQALSDPEIEIWPLPGEAPRVEDWPAERDAFAERWRGGLREALIAAFPATKKDAAPMKVKGIKYLRKRVATEAAKVTQWLGTRPDFATRPAGAGYWTRGEMRKNLVDRDAPVPEELAALQSLLAFPGRVAAGRQADFAREIRQRFAELLARRRQQTYDDLLLTLSRRLRTPGPERDALVRAVGSRFRAALIDEFQDTDSQQWCIFSELFGGGEHFLYLIGDPKQAIYGFRGANIEVYLAARRQAGERVYTMGTNWRSDQRLVDACNALMDRPGFFGEPLIPYVPVDVPPGGARGPGRLRLGHGGTSAHPPPLELRFMDGRMMGVDPPPEDTPLTKTALEALLPSRVAADIVALLEAGAELHDPRDAAAGEDGFRPLRPGDIAVLVRKGAQATRAQRALADAGVPAVLWGAESVLASEAARELELWLAALAAPAGDRPARRAATTALFGGDAGEVIAGVEAEDPSLVTRWEVWLGRLAEGRRTFEQGGVLRAFDRIMADEDVAGRMLRSGGGERHLTNLLHVAELLHAAQAQERFGLLGLLSWLRRQRTEERIDADLAELRLERDDAAVRVLTMHKAKGLEFPVVFVPFSWSEGRPRGGGAVRCAHPEAPARRLLDLRLDRADSEARRAAEARREGLRLLYVALTRARHRTVLYAGHINELEHTPLGPALHGDRRPGEDASEGADRLALGRLHAPGPRGELLADLERLVERARPDPDAEGSISLSRCMPPGRPRWTGGRAAADDPLCVRDFLRTGVVGFWRRHSYSALTTTHLDDAASPSEHAPAEPTSAEGADPRIADGADFDQADPTAGDAPLAPPPPPGAIRGARVSEDEALIPLATFPAGADAGTFLHEVLEHVDFRDAAPGAAPVDPDRTLASVLSRKLPEHGLSSETWAEPLHAALGDVLRTPLGGPLRDLRLCDIPPEDRLDELRFDFPLAGGGAWRPGAVEPVGRDAIAGALRTRLGPDGRSDHELALRGAWLAGLGTPQRMAGFMTGSIDLVFRHRAGGAQTWWVVDYKSNRLDPERRRRYLARFYDPEGLRDAMEAHGYPLQYHIYTAALDRFLRWRLGEAWVYERDFGGVYYLFLRGMTGPDTPRRGSRRRGCFFDRPPAAAIDALQRAFAGRLGGEGEAP